MQHTPKKLIKVAAGVLRNATGAVLLAQRSAGKAMAGRWEFPGGKLFEGEAPAVALARELREELGVEVEASRPLIRLNHDYPDLSVELDVYRVDRYRGEPQPLEDQALAWVPVAELSQWELLEADRPIVAALQLPDRCLVTPAPESDIDVWMRAAETTLAGNIRLLQCRLPESPSFDRMTLARTLRALCARNGVDFIWNGTAEEAEALDADGWHLSAACLMANEWWPLPRNRRVGASCHTEAEVRHANRLGLDYIIVGTVLSTPSHPGGPTLGWDGFEYLARLSNLPAYAIGGMRIDDIPKVQALGGQGIAAIRGLWGNSAWD